MHAKKAANAPSTAIRPAAPPVMIASMEMMPSSGAAKRKRRTHSIVARTLSSRSILSSIEAAAGAELGTPRSGL